MSACACAFHHGAVNNKTTDSVGARSRSSSPPAGVGAGSGLVSRFITISINFKIAVNKVAIIRAVNSMHGTDTKLRLLDKFLWNIVGFGEPMTFQVLSARPGRLRWVTTHSDKSSDARIQCALLQPKLIVIG